MQLLEKATFENFAEDQFRKNSNVSMNICKSLDQLKEHIAWKKLPEQLFPEDLYLPWLNQVLNWEIKSITKIEAHENAHYLHNEGVRLERIDLLEKAEEIYQRLIDATESPAFEIYYLASNTEAISDIYLKQGELEKAYLFRNKTTEIYQSNLDSIINNYSTHSHYTEYLFRNYFFDGPIIKSSANDLEKHATMCEDEGKGHYSKPTMLRITLALHENKEDKAIFLMARLLILLEQLFDETQNCLNHTDESLFPKFHSFLRETLAFFKETENGYYYDPKLRWDDVKDLSPKTIIDTWEERKAELREKFKS
ncbi:hypothetical protein LVD15_24030 [Fulvivirga maritima]|uniref:hypothetical protein n=1 Tax=Fulvivirga maritima TaxID=2904247 RepID=UPI001F41E30F|nr:hypothetical protein [Fulvivirga maritima]UII26329.1 hypothetical protein LVD15_24030 [Fulvivirga maritima]